ncbi:MAG: DUF2723 domain-containing protein [candidate division Zixibacteria bacterium]|nr:DUF2723 domain-containing protein [candidate division Zixibacteria bacterium]
MTAFLYVFLTRPFIWYSDAAEFVIQPAFLAHGHYPGYPFPAHVLYLAHLLGGSPAYFASVINALCAAAAVPLLYLVWRELQVRPSIAFPMALAFALALPVWETATAGPEVYTLELLTAAAVLYLALAAFRRDDNRYFLAAAFVFALALGNRLTFAYFAPWLLAVFFVIKKKPVSFTIALLWFGLSAYLFLIIRWHYFGNQWPFVSTINLRGTLNYFSMIINLSCYGGAGGAYANPWNHIVSNLIFTIKYGPLILALVGIGALFAKRRIKCSVLLLGLLLSLSGFLWLFQAYVGEPERPYLVIPSLIIFTLAAAGAEGALRWLIGRGLRVAVLASVLFAVPAYYFFQNRFFADHRYDRGAESFALEGTKTVGYENAVWGEHANFLPFAYYHFVRGARPDLTYACLTAEVWVNARARLRKGNLPTFRERDDDRSVRKPRAAYVVTSFQGISDKPYYTPRFVPEEFLARKFARLPPGGLFAVAFGDVVPRATSTSAEGPGAPRCGSESPRPAKDLFWKAPRRRLKLAWKIGTGAFVVGRAKGDGLELYGVASEEYGTSRVRIPTAFRGGARPVVDFTFVSPPGRPRKSLILEIDDAKFRCPSSGIIFVSLSADWRPVGDPSYYYAGGPNLHQIFETSTGRQKRLAPRGRRDG